MKNNMKICFNTIILYSLCAVIWIVLAVDRFIEGSDIYILVLNSLCAVMWTFVAILNIVRYRKQKVSEQ